MDAEKENGLPGGEQAVRDIDVILAAGKDSTSMPVKYEKKIDLLSNVSTWSVPTKPKSEAKALASLIGVNDETPQTIRELISVGEKDRAELGKLVAQVPALRGRVEGALAYRQKVLAEFDRIVATKQSA